MFLSVAVLFIAGSFLIKGKKEDITDSINRMSPIIFEAMPLSLEEIFIYEDDDKNVK